MVREDIVAGLKQAISKGESLRQAMMSFYKAGYKKEEIEEAARFLQSEQVQERMTMTYSETQENKKPIQNIPKYNPPSQERQIQQTPVQRISQYGSQTELEQKPTSYKKEKNSKIGWIILISGTLVIIVLLILAIIFKTPITNFLDKLMG